MPVVGADEVDRERGVGFLEVEDDGGGIGRFDGGDQAEGAALGGFVGGIHHEFEGGFHVGGGERAAVVEVDVVAEMEDVGERIGSVPGFGEIAVEFHLGVAFEEAGEEQAVDVLRIARRWRSAGRDWWDWIR